ncbi:FkbM family methyltransferase, partial [Candidatus Latescibacterota bacterium]
LMVSNATTISSLSKDWIESVKESGRFSDYRWDTSETVKVTTFDRLIEEHGVPAFTKIDVEGFEAQVIKGLSCPAGVISFEFTPEFLTSAIDSIDHLSTIGHVEFNYSLGETMRLELSSWTTAEDITAILNSLSGTSVFGDVYTRFIVG